MTTGILYHSGHRINGLNQSATTCNHCTISIGVLLGFLGSYLSSKLEYRNNVAMFRNEKAIDNGMLLIGNIDTFHDLFHDQVEPMELTAKHSDFQQTFEDTWDEDIEVKLRELATVIRSSIQLYYPSCLAKWDHYYMVTFQLAISIAETKNSDEHSSLNQEKVNTSVLVENLKADIISEFRSYMGLK